MFFSRCCFSFQSDNWQWGRITHLFTSGSDVLMMRQLFSIVLVFVFLLFLTIPPLLTLLTPDQKISEIEKRELATSPKFNWTSTSLKEYPKQFESYYNDHFGLRDYFVFYQHLFSLKMFGVSSSPFVTIGSDNWLFYNGEGLSALHSFLGLKTLSSFTLGLYQDTLIYRRSRIKSYGGKYLFLPVPNKMTIYPEFLPQRIRKNAQVGLYDELIPYLIRKQDFVNFIDLKALFLQEKVTKQLYLKTDTHWNWNGAFLAYSAVSKWLVGHDVSMRSLAFDDIQWQLLKGFSGDLALFLHVKDILTETAPEPAVVPACSDTTIPLKFIDTRKRNSDLFQQFKNDSRQFGMVQECAANDTTLLLIHDSFGRFLKPLFAKSFGTVFFASRGFDDILDFIDTIHPDVVIDERVERYFATAFNSIFNIEIQRQEKKVFNAAERYVFRLNTKRPAKGFSHAPFATVVETEKGLIVTSDQEYPSIVFTYSAEDSMDRPRSVKIELTSQHDTECILLFTTRYKPLISLEQAVRLPVRSGYNEYYFRLPITGEPAVLQFFPGKASGRYIIHSFDVKM